MQTPTPLLQDQAYIRLALCTESLPTWAPEERRRGLRFAHAMLGLESEILELDEALAGTDPVAVIEELGDVSWYWAILADVLGCDGQVQGPDLPFEISVTRTVGAFPSPDQKCLLLHLLTLEVGRLANTCKRILFYGKDELADPAIRQQTLVAHARVGHWIRIVSRFSGSDVAVIRSKNIQKLQARYPQKFEAHRALHRDLDAERAALVGSDQVESILLRGAQDSAIERP